MIIRVERRRQEPCRSHVELSEKEKPRAAAADRLRCISE